MPGISFIGTKPTEESALSRFGRGAGDIGRLGMGMAESLRKGKMEEKKFGLEERRVGISEQALAKQLETIEYNKKRDIANMVTQAVKDLDKESAADFVSKPEVKALFDDLGWPVPEGQPKKTPKEIALEAVEKGELLPGMTKEQRDKMAGIYIAPGKITEKDIKDITPWESGDWIPWKESTRERLNRLRKEKLVRQLGGGTPSAPKGSDPLNVRK